MALKWLALQQLEWMRLGWLRMERMEWLRLGWMRMGWMELWTQLRLGKSLAWQYYRRCSPSGLDRHRP
jgi:hypothetical protein